MFEYRDRTRINTPFLVDEERDLEYRVVAVQTHELMRYGALLRIGTDWIPLGYTLEHLTDKKTSKEYLLRQLDTIGFIIPTHYGRPRKGYEDLFYSRYEFHSRSEQQAVTKIAIEAIICYDYCQSAFEAGKGLHTILWDDQVVRVTVPPSKREWRASAFGLDPRFGIL